MATTIRGGEKSLAFLPHARVFICYFMQSMFHTCRDTHVAQGNSKPFKKETASVYLYSRHDVGGNGAGGIFRFMWN